MSDVNDNDLILFHYRDGLTAERLREIEGALTASPPLATRYRALQRLLGEADRDIPPQPDEQFESRLWQRLEPHLGSPAETVTAVPPVSSARRHHARPRRRAQWWGVGLASTALLAVALYVPTTRVDVAVQPQLVQSAPADTAMSDRVLTAYVAEHLRSTEGLLLTVVNNDSGTLMPADDSFTRSLIIDNRLYAAAAEKQGDDALATFLKSLEPVLIEVANHASIGAIQQGKGLRDFVQDTDLLFQVRAVEARLHYRNNVRPATRGAMT